MVLKERLQNNMYQKEDNYELLFGFLQVIDLLLNLSQTSNDDLMRELQQQDKKYLETIIKQNEEILNILKNK